MVDDRLELARLSLESVLAEQLASRRNVRSLALTALGTGAVAESLSFSRLHGSIDGLSRVLAYLSVVAFGALLFTAIGVLRSRVQWGFGTSGAKVLEWAGQGRSMDRIDRRVSEALIQTRADNAKVLDRHAKHFGLALYALAGTVVLSAVAQLS